MSRSLVLAGGGMRVAWQAGVLLALEEDGLTFDHVDGTSGGILTAAAHLSGVGAADLCRRWRDVDVRDFGSALPLRDYLRGPWNLPAIGDADGMVQRVMPALGIDVDAVRRSDVAGTFNVVDFVTKACVALDARDVDAPLLAAGMSLPGWVTPLHRDGHVWTDAVWVRDANVAEALRRGADEVWLVWCIGNSPAWRDGPLEQYVHMIEMSAAGALAADLQLAAATGRDFVLHVVHPQLPLPLDPELYLGRVDADSLVQLGYRDARRYLDARTAGGVPHTVASTATPDPPPSARFTERLRGQADGQDVTLDLTVVLPLDGLATAALVAGALTVGDTRSFLADGHVVRGDGTLAYVATTRIDGRLLEVVARRDTVDDPGPDRLRDLDRVHLTVRACDDGASVLDGELRLGGDGLRRLLASVEPVGVRGVLRRADVVRRFLARADALTRPA
ncbi:patatin-like phospholipase family protein [Cellulomonas sp. S1-8]|uniref:patatin-like phospholipase family protein n=1 Tax=Cellulomonas sp. S1-8 TaxID=2904790 RepID=UPI0022449934|nr:patatin-like phospholipase family protein [Cellulomonas sp. S1-8]UZN04648.1 patatin-like phospholipase family protein [Cellulomonas sp. S1-8]